MAHIGLEAPLQVLRMPSRKSSPQRRFWGPRCGRSDAATAIDSHAEALLRVPRS